ncbi:protein mono-ADP-ribosyltransferase PARP14-like [Bufo gargarizans]|uniref:protein mono-ADP-ribosyltransferase PARP14-like n=1 Tax=Bufo gargarizans TaxID=30331 RepID=UPI001CF34BB0|nr:protein mono-ADP-ribosyltransferase PARP14-like [Bufo gargarizans]
MGDSCYLYPVALRWDEGPEALKQVKNKLLLHFQKRKLSNGGECEIRDLDCSRGHLLIYFRDEGVRDRVLQKTSQELQLPGNKTLKLDVTSVEALSGGPVQDVPSEKPGRSEPIPNPAADVSQHEAGGQAQQLLSDVVLIENVQDSCSAEMLTLLIENSRDRNDDTKFHLETIPEIHSAAITFTSDIDVLSFIQKFCANHKVIQKNLRAKPLEETRSIRAEGLPPRTEEDLIILYFENPKIGGGQVEEAVMIPEEEAALVTFYDAHVVKVIVETEHILGKKAISVYRYYPTLGTILYGRKTPQVTKPLPIQIQISPYLLEFIWKDTRLKQSIEEDLSNKMCEIIWPDLKCSDPVITLCFPNSLSSHLRTMAKVGRTWTEKVSAAYSVIISRYKVIECKMHPSAWEDIKVQISTAAYDGVLVKPTADAEKVFLAGAIRDVNKIEQTFKKLVEENSRKAERRSKQTTKTEPMSAALYHVICSSGLEKKILAEAPEMKMEYDPSTHNVRLTGLRDEVLEAKCEILSVVQHLKSKSIQLNPHVLQYLKFADNDEISCLLFIRHNINAVIEMEENSIKLTGHTKKDLTDAEEQIGQELICQRILIEDKNVLQSPEWKSLLSHLLQSHCSEMCTVMIEEFPPGAENDVVVAGLASSVHKSYKEIHEFVEKNTPVQKNIPVKSVAVMQFIMEERHLMEVLKQINVKVVTKHRHIHLAGAKSYVEEAASHVQTTLSSIFHDTLHIDKPGAKKHYLTNEKMYVPLVRSNYKCIIHLQKDEEDDEIPNETTGAAPQYQVQLPRGVTISVYRGDLCSHHADVIVNAANEDLEHIGGLALALLNAAGRQLQDESDRIVRQRGRLVPGQSVITAAGNLPCKQVIHTVGPRWNPSSSERSKNLLRTAITSSLELAAKYSHRSIAIPAVSSGIFGFPIPVSAQNIVEAIKDYMEGKGRSSSVTNINLVDTKDETIAAFTKSLKEHFGAQNSPRNLAMEVMAPSSREQGAAASQSIGNVTLVVQVKEGLLQDATTGVIVNSVGKDLRLDSGGASKALYEKAGHQLQVSLQNKASRAANAHVFVTRGYNLSCDIVIHVVVPFWDGGKGFSEQIFRQTIQTCLNTAEERRLRSITFPAIGTGNLGFPKHLVAAFMFDEVFKFSSSSGNRFLQKVTFMLHPNDKETIKEFYKEQNARKTNPALSNQVSTPASEAELPPPPRSDTAFYGAANTLNLGVYEMRVGSITYQVKTGDITKEDTDVIVNSTDQQFNLRSGVSKSILEAAGPGVQAECAQLASLNKKSSHITTQSGNLLCKQILHVVGRNSAEGIGDFVAESLQECGNLQASSVAFPAIGTGLGKVSSAVVADIILEAVTEFAKSKAAPCLQMVKVVVFQQQMLDDFYNSMKKKEGTDLPKSTSLLSRITNSVVNYFTSRPGAEKKQKVFHLRENIEPAIFHLCAGNRKDVTDASTWLRDLILKEQYENEITDDWILEFDEQDHHALSQDQRRLQVLLSFESLGSTVKISGLTRDVLEMTNKIQLMIKKVRENKTKEREAELCSNLVEWRYHNGTKFVQFDRMTNLELEKAKSTNTQSLKIDVSGVTYTVLLERNCMRDPRGKEAEIERIPKHGQFELPANWTAMSNKDVMTVQLTHGNQEYNDVETQFKMSCQMKIVKIERIQNKNLWMNYQIKRQAIDTKNGTTTTNEKRLFHGTDSNTIQTVNHNGFNRSYAGRNAACYGNGTYFAVEANYSAHDGYSKPDPNGLKYMYLARVLTGVYCAGQKGIVAPPAKNPANPTELYDSVTDNPAKPSMFVIFHDIQAYPEYLITFTR